MVWCGLILVWDMSGEGYFSLGYVMVWVVFGVGYVGCGLCRCGICLVWVVSVWDKSVYHQTVVGQFDTLQDQCCQCKTSRSNVSMCWPINSI